MRNFEIFPTQPLTKLKKNISTHHNIKKSTSLLTHDRKSLSTKHITPSDKERYQKKFNKINNKTLAFKRKYTEFKSKLQTCSFSYNSNIKSKWSQIVDLYKGNQVPCKNKNNQHSIQNTINSGEEAIIKKYPLKIKFPETIMMDSYGQMKIIFTNPITNLVDVKQIQKNQYFSLLKQNFKKHINQLKNYPIKYKKYLDFQQNPYSPYLVAKIADDLDTNFQVDVQTYKIFSQKKTRPTQNKFIQRYIYSRNMKAMIFRLCYEKNSHDQQKQEYYGYRFQNVDNIFRSKHSDIMESNKLTSVIFVTYERENKIEYIKIVNKNGLTKFIQPSQFLIKFLESVHKVKIRKIQIDYIVDLFDQPWLINIKLVEIEDENKKVLSSFNKVQKIVSCKVCADTFQKNQLKKYASNKMVAQFIDHLKKRMKIQDYDKIKFLKNINKINTKQHITFHICEGCYLLISQEFMLIQNQKKLAGLCNIKIKDQFLTHQIGNIPTQPKGTNQWRLMIFLLDIVNIPQTFLKNQTINVKYHLKQEIQQSWNIKVSQKNLPYNSSNKTKNNSININKIKVHYFFSDTNQIDKFLKQTQIFLTLSSKNTLQDLNNQNIASGSTGILSHFCNRYQNDLCLRQTSALLLFFGDGKYCQASIKVGLVCDGMYCVPQNIKLKKINNVYFAEDGYVNSNPIPRQWMQAFGINEQINIPSLNYQDIVEIRNNRIYEKQNEDKGYCLRKNKYKNKKRLERKSVCYL